MSKEKIIHLINKINKNKLIGLDLLKILNDKRLISLIHKNAVIHLNNNLNNYSFEGSRGLVMLSMAIIAFENYDGSIWKYFESTYNQPFNTHDKKVKQLITEILSRYNFIFNNPRYVDTSVSFGIVPKKFFKNYLEFLFDLYKINFNYTLPLKDDDLYDHLKEILNYLRLYLDPDTDNFNLDDIDNSKKSYMLIKSTKRLISNVHYHDQLITYTSYLLKQIELFYDGEKVENSFIESALSSMDMSKGQTITNSKERQNKLNAYSKHPFFYLRNRELYLKVPHKYFKKGEITDTYYKVFINDDLMLESSLRIRSVIGRYQIDAFSIKIPKAFDTLTFEIHDQIKGLIYNHSLKFSPMFFDSDGDRIMNIDYHHQNILFLDLQINNNYRYQLNSIGYFIHEITSLNNTNYIQTSADNIYLTNIMKSHNILGHMYSNAKALYNKEIPIFKFIEFIQWKSRYTLSNTDQIFINGFLYKSIDDIRVTFIDGEYFYSLSIEKTHLINDNDYNIIHFYEREIKKETIEFIIIKDLTVDNVTETNYTIKSSVKINRSYELTVPISQNTFELNLPNIDAAILLNIDEAILSLNENDWILFEDNISIWHEDLKKSIKFRGFNISEIEILILDNHGTNLSSFTLEQGENFEFVLNTEIIANFIIHDYIIFYIDKKAIYVYFKPQILNNDIVEVKPYLKEVHLNTQWIGPENLIIKITDSNDNIVFNEKLKEKVKIDSLVPMNLYSVKFYKPERFSEDLLIFSHDFYYYTFEDMEGKKFDVIEGIFDIYKDDTQIRKHIKLSNMLHIESYNHNERTLTATLYDTFKNKMIPYDFNPVTISPSMSSNQDKFWFEINTVDGEDLCLNSKNIFIIHEKYVTSKSQSLTVISILTKPKGD